MWWSTVKKNKLRVKEFGAYGWGGVNLLHHAIEIVKIVLVERMQSLMKLSEMHFGFMLHRKTVDALFMVKKMLEEH